MIGKPYPGSLCYEKWKSKADVIHMSCPNTSRYALEPGVRCNARNAAKHESELGDGGHCPSSKFVPAAGKRNAELIIVYKGKHAYNRLG